jgi:hypothetical protein
MSSTADQITNDALKALRQATAENSVTIFIDPTLADPLNASEDLAAAYSSGAASKVRLPIIHNDIDPDHSPYLIFVANEPAAERLVNATVSLAVREALGEVKDNYLGRSVCGWIIGEKTPRDLAKNIARIASVRRPGGEFWPLRFWDPRVMWHLPRVLDPEKLDRIHNTAGPWWTLDPMMQFTQMVTVQRDELTEPPRLRFEAPEWVRLERIGNTNIVLKMAFEWGVLPTTANAERIDGLLQKCQTLGFETDQDALIFAACGLTSHARFYDHPSVQEAIQKAAKKSASLQSAIKEFDDDFWADIATGHWLNEKKGI